MAIRLQTRHWRALTWVATLGVAGGAGYELWTIVKNFRTGQYKSKSSSDFNAIIEQATGSINKKDVAILPRTDYEKLWKSPYNGYVKVVAAKTDAPPPPPPEPTKKPISDVLSVKAVTYAPDDQGRVVIEYRDDKDTALAHTDQIILKVDAKLVQPYDAAPFNASLKTITANAAIFNWCGEEVEVHPKRKEEISKAPKAAPKGPKSTSLNSDEEKLLAQHKDSKESINLGGEKYLIGSDDRNNMNKNGDKFLEDITIKTRTGADKNPEVVLNGIRPKSSLATNYGMQNDDVVVSINGVPVTSKNQAIQWARDNPNLPRYDVVIRRKGKDFTKTFLVPQN